MPEGDDKTEAPTERRRSDARKQGQVAKSTELSSVTVLLALLLVLQSAIRNLSQLLTESFVDSMRRLDQLAISPERIFRDASLSALLLLRAIGPLVLAAMVTGIVVNVAQTGPLWAIESLKPNFNKLNPLTGIQNLLSMRSVVELAKSLYKIGIVGLIAFFSIRGAYPQLMLLGRMELRDAVGVIGSLIYGMSLRIVGTMFVLAALDYAYQRFALEKRLKMTKQEVKQEYKQNELAPELKSRIRARQREMAKKRMMDDVPKADVVITNPTHFAVALRYDAERMGAPIVVAKGADFLAKRIRETAIDADVPIIENPPLARALYRQTEIGGEIPVELYEAVAEALAFVYEVNRRRRERERLGNPLSPQ